ncbi:MAG TPA: AtpZ/AtpI family protein [Vampirovibrionales bacterium]
MNKALKAYEVGLSPLTGAAGFGFLGNLADKHFFEDSHWFLIGGVLLGFISGIVRLSKYKNEGIPD